VLIGLGKLRAQNLYDGSYWDGRLWLSSPNVAAIAVDAAGDLIAAGNKLVFSNLTPVGVQVRATSFGGTASIGRF
jgi:hypothetical protein